jgi:hypothetical protein
MKAVRIIIGSAAIAFCMSGCSVAVVEHDLSSGGPSLGQPAILEYKISGTTLSGVELIEIDGHPVAERRANVGGGAQIVFKLAPGTHRVRFKGDEGFPVHPDVVEFEAGAGKRYRLEFERFNNKETDGQVTTLYFNFVTPVVFGMREGKPYKVAAGAKAPFDTGFDAQKNVLLYEETVLPQERTARVYCPRQLWDIYIVKISGRAGETCVEYQRSWFDLSQYYHALPGSWPDPRKLRLLPGKYVFVLTLDPQSHVPGAATARAAAALSQKGLLTLNAEAGHTYQIITKAKGGVGGTLVEMAFEDVTGKNIIDDRPESTEIDPHRPETGRIPILLVS